LDNKAEATPELLKSEHFEPHIGKVFHFRGTRYAFPLDHISIDRQELPSWVPRRPFILIFRGPKERDVLPEGLYTCDIESGPSHDIYVAPMLTPEPDRQYYQAIFN